MRAKLGRYALFAMLAPIYGVAWACIFLPYGRLR